MKWLAQLLLTIAFAALFFAPTFVSAAELRSEYQINDHGQNRTFVIATDELQVIGKRQPDKILTAPSAEAARQQAMALGRSLGKEVQLVLYPRRGARSEFSRRILTREVLVHLEPGESAEALARANGATLSGSPDYLANHFLFLGSEPGGALQLAEALRAAPRVISAQPQLARLVQKKLLPNDTLFPEQWHLRNIGQNGATPGIDINVTNVWNYFRGTNIYIGIIDDGLQYTHPDLAANCETNIDYDFNDHDSTPAPDPANEDFHGTAVAGVAAARGNNGLGVTGAACEAKLVGLRLVAFPETDGDDAAAMSHSNAVIHIKNNSWGAPDCDPFIGTVLDGAGPLMKAAIAEGVATGRSGKGVIYTFAGGNGRQCGEDANYDGYANSINVFAIGALGDDGTQPPYSEPGACLVVVTPSSDPNQRITTTDLAGNDGYNFSGASGEVADLNYTKTFGGTSSATPLAAGVIALVLQANTNLSYRDVKEILLRSSTKAQPADGDWRTNSAGIAHNHKFGAGLINAEAAVNLATNWGYLGPVTNISLLQTNLNISIPDNDVSGVTRSFTFTNANFRVEHVTLTMTAPHQYWGDLAVTLTSPGGMASRLAQVHQPVDPTYDYEAWPFSSVRHWGEKANGTWTVKVADLAPGYAGVLEALEVKLYGSVPAPKLTAVRTNQNVRLILQAAAPGWSYAIDTSSNMLSWTPVITNRIATVGSTNYTDTNALLQPRRFYRARLAP